MGKLKGLPKSLDYFCRLISIAELIHEEATPLETLNNPKNYEVSAPLIKDLGDILQELNSEFLKLEGE